MQHVAKEEPATFTDLLRARCKGILEPIAGFLDRLGLTPNAVTLIGLFGTIIAACFLAAGHITIGGLIILVFVPLDALDGTLARMRGKTSRFGAFLDSVTDRYAELAIFGGLLYYFMQQQNWLGVVLSYLAAAGSVLVSYIRARAEAVGYETKIGILTRVERFIILIPCLIFNIPVVAVGLIALLANITALQRIFHVRSQANLEK